MKKITFLLCLFFLLLFIGLRQKSEIPAKKTKLNETKETSVIKREVQELKEKPKTEFTVIKGELIMPKKKRDTKHIPLYKEGTAETDKAIGTESVIFHDLEAGVDVILPKDGAIGEFDQMGEQKTVPDNPHNN